MFRQMTQNKQTELDSLQNSEDGQIVGSTTCGTITGSNYQYIQSQSQNENTSQKQSNDKIQLLDNKIIQLSCYQEDLNQNFHFDNKGEDEIQENQSQSYEFVLEQEDKTEEQKTIYDQKETKTSKKSTIQQTQGLKNLKEPNELNISQKISSSNQQDFQSQQNKEQTGQCVRANQFSSLSQLSLLKYNWDDQLTSNQQNSFISHSQDPNNSERNKDKDDSLFQHEDDFSIVKIEQINTSYQNQNTSKKLNNQQSKNQIESNLPITFKRTNPNDVCLLNNIDVENTNNNHSQEENKFQTDEKIIKSQNKNSKIQQMSDEYQNQIKSKQFSKSECICNSDQSFENNNILSQNFYAQSSSNNQIQDDNQETDYGIEKQNQNNNSRIQQNYDELKSKIESAPALNNKQKNSNNFTEQFDSQSSISRVYREDSHSLSQIEILQNFKSDNILSDNQFSLNILNESKLNKTNFYERNIQKITDSDVSSQHGQNTNNNHSQDENKFQTGETIIKIQNQNSKIQQMCDESQIQIKSKQFNKCESFCSCDQLFENNNIQSQNFYAQSSSNNQIQDDNQETEYGIEKQNQNDDSRIQQNYDELKSQIESASALNNKQQNSNNFTEQFESQSSISRKQREDFHFLPQIEGLQSFKSDNILSNNQFSLNILNESKLNKTNFYERNIYKITDSDVETNSQHSQYSNQQPFDNQKHFFKKQSFDNSEKSQNLLFTRNNKDQTQIRNDNLSQHLPKEGINDSK